MRILIFLLLINSTSFAQTTNKVKDTFAINILSTVDKVLRIAEDPKRSAFELAGEPIKVGLNGATIYNAAIQLPGTVSTLEQINTWRSSGYTQWQWQAKLIDLPKGKGETLIMATKRKLDSLLSFFKTRKRSANPDGDWELTTNAWSNSPLYNEDGLLLTIHLKKKLHNNEQQAVDSLVKLYQPLMADPRIAYQRASTFSNAFRFEDIPNEKTAQAYLNSIKEVATINIESAYHMMMSAPYFMKMEDIVTQLTDAQKARIRELARKALDDFYGTTNYTAKDPVIEKKKEIKEKQPPSDPCEREIWELAIKPGYYISGNGRVAYVRDYNCASDSYTIFYLNAEGKRLLNEPVSKSAMDSYRHSSAAPFIICSNCRGAGYSMEYDWYQVNVASNYYARSNDQRKYTCGVCSGSGFIKVR
jgi:hypothetical protein